jgi:anti-sigma B factor antagonist
MKVEKLEGGSIAVLHPKGSIIGNKETDDLRSELEKLGKDGNTKVVINLSKVTYINSTGLGVLIAGYNDYKQRSGQIKLCNVAESIENVFVITKLTSVFDIYATEKEAVGSFSS